MLACAANVCLRILNHDNSAKLFTQCIMALTRENSTRLGFVISAACHGAISIAELREWALQAIMQEDSVPTYILELSEYSGFPNGLFRVIGFVPEWPFSDGAKQALAGIAHLRGTNLIDVGISSEQGLRRLKACPFVAQAFQREFPFTHISAWPD